MIFYLLFPTTFVIAEFEHDHALCCTHFPLFCIFFFSFLVVWYLVFVFWMFEKKGREQGEKMKVTRWRLSFINKVH